MKKKLIIIAAAIALLAAGTGIGILATGSGYGSESDPLITLSYLRETVEPQLEEKVSKTVEAESEEYAEKIDQSILELQESLSGDASGDVFTYVVIPSGKTMTCDAGTELMLRSGSCEAYGSGAAVLSDTTSGSVIGEGASVTNNHLCIVTASGGGVTAVSGDAELLVRGNYSID